MDTVSFFLRVSLWVIASVLLVWAVFVNTGVLSLSLFFLVVLLAWGYSAFDNAFFGKVIHQTRLPASTVKEVEDDPYVHLANLDTHYHRETPETLIRVLEDLRKNRTPVRLLYGDVDTGRKEHSATGYVNRSSGALQIPLLAPRGERGGVPIMDHCILQIVALDKDFVLYQHPSYQEAEEVVEAEAG